MVQKKKQQKKESLIEKLAQARQDKKLAKKRHQNWLHIYNQIKDM